MRPVQVHSSHGGEDLWRSRDEFDWLLSVFEVPALDIRAKSGPEIRAAVDREFGARGWAMEFKIAPNSNLTVTAKRGDLAFQIQTGNVARGGYDLLKLQHLYLTGAIEAAAIALPTRDAAAIIGSNITNGDRMLAEVRLFSREITVPLVLVEFE